MYPPVLLHHLLDGPACAPERTAIVEGDRALTYGAFRAAVSALSRRLTATGVAPGDRVAILLPKSIPECVAIFAIP
jgi:acyl-CoA synthetase (AMP-forming)/AMP-acid ligase II